MSGMRIMVTGGAGFIGSAYVRHALADPEGARICVYDLLTYAGHRENLTDLPAERMDLVVGDVADAQALRAACDTFAPDAIVHFAAETHVDRSLSDPQVFVRTNVQGTQAVLDVASERGIRLVLVSTDEVYGDRAGREAATPGTALDPSNVYAATKAAGDMLAIVAHRQRGQDVVITRCTNNYGPRQTPEKLIPLMILRAAADEELPVYGDGQQQRDWLHANDHADGVHRALRAGTAGRVYHFAGGMARTNLSVIHALLAELGETNARIRHVADRPAHDLLYALDCTASVAELGWAPRTSFASGLAETVAWYRANTAWCRAVAGPELNAFLEANYGGRAEHR